MAYKKSAEEIKWRKWKSKEEENLRALGVDEDVIARLHTSDWEAFNAERRYQQQQTVASPYLELQPYLENQSMTFSVQDLLDTIENEKLLNLLINTDKLTLQILVFKSIGLSSVEIARKLELSVNAVDLRVWRIKEKIKNIFS